MKKRRQPQLLLGVVVAAGMFAVVAILLVGWLNKTKVPFRQWVEWVPGTEPLSNKKHARDMDPAGRSSVSPRFSPEVFEDRKSTRSFDLGIEDYDRFGPLVGWAASPATDDRFGCSVSLCRVKYMRKAVDGGSCDLRQRLYVQPSGEGPAFIARVDSILPEEFTSACGELARCLRDAWLGRELETPDLGPFVLEEKVYLPFADVISSETSDAQWAELYDQRMAEQIEDNRQRHLYVEQHKNEHSSGWRESMVHNLTMGEMRIEDARQMTLWLRGDRQSCEEVE